MRVQPTHKQNAVTRSSRCIHREVPSVDRHRCNAHAGPGRNAHDHFGQPARHDGADIRLIDHGAHERMCSRCGAREADIRAVHRQHDRWMPPIERAPECESGRKPPVHVHDLVRVAGASSIRQLPFHSATHRAQQAQQRDAPGPCFANRFGHRASIRERHVRVACITHTFYRHALEHAAISESNRAGSDHIDAMTLGLQSNGETKHERSRRVTVEAWHVVRDEKGPHARRAALKQGRGSAVARSFRADIHH